MAAARTADSDGEIAFAFRVIARQEWHDQGLDPANEAGERAKATAAEAYLQTAIHAVQMHGGIGFTWDNDTHLWFKRAKSSEILFGDANYHRELMMQNWKQ